MDTFAQQEHDPDKPLSALEKFRMNAKKALLAWTGNAITKYTKTPSLIIEMLKMIV